MYFGGPWNEKCWYILWQFGIISDHLVSYTYGRLVEFGYIWYTFPVLVCLDQEKSGNPGLNPA
jgi:hypothetical protein